jgi:hypothetical protein
MTVEQLLASMTSREFIEWKAFLEIERTGGRSQGTLDLDAKIKTVWASVLPGASSG